MFAIATLALAATASLTAPPSADASRWIDVDCRSAHALEHALAKAKRLGGADILLHGLCEGHFVITSDGVALRGATPDSGISAPAGSTYPYAVLEVVNVSTYLNGLTVRGGVYGVLARGWDADVVLSNVEVHDQINVGVVASQGASAVLFNSTVRDGAVGIAAWSNGKLTLQRVVVNNRTTGVAVTEGSSAGLNETTITNSRGVGLFADSRSDAFVSGSVFRENGFVHIAAESWSGVNVRDDVTLGSASDTTQFALGARSQSTIICTTPDIYGDVYVYAGSSAYTGNTVLHGDLIVGLFSNAHVQNGEITGNVVCSDDADAICDGATSAGVSQCPSPTCGSPTPEATARARSLPELPTMPHLNHPSRSSPRM